MGALIRMLLIARQQWRWLLLGCGLSLVTMVANALLMAVAGWFIASMAGQPIAPNRSRCPAPTWRNRLLPPFSPAFACRLPAWRAGRRLMHNRQNCWGSKKLVAASRP